MSWGVLRAALDLFFASRPAEPAILFYGGEPLLELPLMRRAVRHATRLASPRDGVRFALSTNGMLLGREAAGFLASHRIGTQISFDGSRAAQEIRSPGTFDRLDGMLDRLRVEQPDLFEKDASVAVTLTARMIPHLADSVRHLLRKGVRAIDVSPIATHDPDWSRARRSELEREMGKVFRECLSHYERTGRVPVRLFRKEGREGTRRRRGARCTAATGESLAVDVDGSAYGCAALAESYQRFPPSPLVDRLRAMRLGDLRDPAFPDRLADHPRVARAARIFHAPEAKYSSYGRCRDCPILDRCRICPLSTCFIPGNSDPDRVQDLGCAFNRIAHSWRDRFPRQPDEAEVLTGRAPVPGLLRELIAAVGDEPARPALRGRGRRGS